MNDKRELFVFVVMPFSSDFDKIYRNGIKSACEELNIVCERVDEQIFEESILERIYSQIAKADLIIADLSKPNPNVFYEIGFSHGIGKKVFLLAQKDEQIPFDLKHYPHIIYNGDVNLLYDKLLNRVRWVIENYHFNQFSNQLVTSKSDFKLHKATEDFERNFINNVLQAHNWISLQVAKH